MAFSDCESRGVAIACSAEGSTFTIAPDGRASIVGLCRHVGPLHAFDGAVTIANATGRA